MWYTKREILESGSLAFSWYLCDQLARILLNYS